MPVSDAGGMLGFDDLGGGGWMDGRGYGEVEVGGTVDDGGR